MRGTKRGRLAALIVAASWVLSLPGAVEAEEADEVTAGDEAVAERPVDPGPPTPIGMRWPESLEGRRMRIGYSWERIHRRGLRSGDDAYSPDLARSAFGYTTTPRSLETTIHRFELAYAPHPRVTLVAELPFVQKEFERADPTGSAVCAGASRCQVQTEGVGDLGFAVIVPFIRKGREGTQVHIGFDVPTGSIRRGEPDIGGVRLPYDAQIGNGTVDFEWGWTYRGETDRFAWGGQAVGRHPLARNGLDYREGSSFAGRIWGAAELLSGWSISLRGEWKKQNEIEGFDRGLDKSLDPSADPEKRDGTWLTLAPGMSFRIPALQDQRLGVEFSWPVYRSLDGPQLDRDWSVKTAWQWVY